MTEEASLSITLDNIKLSHGTFNLTANFKIESGKKVAIIGPSGGGKSTLLTTISGFKSPDQGKVFINGNDVTLTPPSERPIALLFQDHNLFPHLSVKKNVSLGINTTLKLTDAELRIVDKALSLVGLKNYENKMPFELSGGEQQRVALARSLLRKKPILCLDEPFAALGPAMKKEMLNLVNEIVESTKSTLLMVTHQPEDALHISDETILISGGVVRAPENTSELFSNPPPELIEYIGA